MPGLPPGVLARALTEAAAAAIAISSERGIEHANDALARLAASARERLAGTQLEMLVAVEHRRAVADVLERVLGGGEADAGPHDILLMAGVDARVPVEHTCRLLEHDGARLAVSTFVPLDDRARVGPALAENDARWRQRLDEDGCGRFEATPSWRLISCNLALAGMLGSREPASFVGRDLREYTPDEPTLQKLLAVARAEGRSGPMELRLRRATGDVVEVACSLTADTDAAGAVVSVRGHARDITAARRAQAQAVGTARMEAIARLAGGLAHDFNNLLTIIKGHSERLLDALPATSPLRESAIGIDEASATAASLTRQLLAFGRRQVFELRPVSLARLAADAAPMVAALLGDRIALRVHSPAGLPEIRADARQLEDVIVNLALNAREAMPSGGTLTVSVDTMEVGDRTPAERQWLRAGRYVRLVVADTGHGMDPLTRANAFQPFFTTKKMAPGRGLGLATVYGIVKQSNGFVWVDSSPGHGAAFTLLFPALDPVRTGDGVRETILAVDADERLRAFVADALRRRGYQVLEASTGAEALALFAASPSRIHLLVCDAGAQTGEGDPLVARIRVVDPMVQCLVLLQPAEAGPPRTRVLPTTPAIEKPFTLQALAEKVRAVLDSGEGREQS